MKQIRFFYLLVLLLGICSCQPRKIESMKIMTFNIRYGTANDGQNSWPQRKEILIRCLQQVQPAILGTQESLNFQIEEILKRFPSYRVFGVGRYHGIELPDRPHESLEGESCKILYDTTRFVVLKNGTFWHSNTPDIPGSMSWGNNLPRITTWGIFKSKTTEKKFVVMNTHYHWDEPYRRNSTRLILKKWREIAADLPTILMGDFNLPPSSEAHQLFCGLRKNDSGPLGKFIDTWQKPEHQTGTYHGFNGDRTGDRIDWILVTSRFHVENSEIIYYDENGKYPSDHFPVIAILTL